MLFVMSNTLVRFITRRFLHSTVSKRSFTRVSYILSVIAYVLATIAIVMVHTITNSLVEQQKSRFLSHHTHLVVDYAQPFNRAGSQELDSTRLQTAIDEIIAAAQQAQEVVEIAPYAGGEFFLQYQNSLVEGVVVGIPANATDTYLATQESQNLPAEVQEHEFSAGKYELIIPSFVQNQYGIQVGDQVTLINATKSQYLPVGQIPITRNFTVVGVYQADSNNSSWYTNMYDLARLNQTKNITQLVVYTRHPLEIESLANALVRKYKLTDEGAYIYTNRQLQEQLKNSPATSTSGVTSIISQLDTEQEAQAGVAAQEANPAPKQGAELGSSATPVSNDATSASVAVVQVQDWRNELAIIFNSIKTETRATTTLTSLLIIIAILSCLITFSFIIVEKDYEIAVLSVMGMRATDITKVFVRILIGLIFKATYISLLLFMMLVLCWPWLGALINLPIELHLDYESIALTYFLCGLLVGTIITISGKFIIKIRPAQVLG